MTELHLAGTYTREVHASIDRIRENVLDWQHLPGLAGNSFCTSELIDEDASGWRVRLTGKGRASAQVQRLEMADDTSSYRVVTESGPGEGNEIRVAVTRKTPHLSHVSVEYHVRESDPKRLAKLGKSFALSYAQIWDQDEAMMRARESALVPRKKIATPGSLFLGEEAEVRQQLPLGFDFGPGRFRLVDVGGTLMAHSETCPHWLGPLHGAPDDAGVVTCPWHGYRFAVASGCSADGHGLQLAPAPAIRIERGRVVAQTAVPAACA